MAKLLISCDDNIFIHNNRFYYKNQDWYQFYQRYLRVFEEMRIANRCRLIESLKSEMVPIDDERIEIVRIPEFHGPQQYAKVFFSIGKIVREITKGCDAAILRIPSTIAERVGKQVVKSGIPYACEVVYDAEDAWRGSKWFRRMIWKRIDNNMRYLCSKADGVSCVTESYLQQHYFPQKKTSFTEHYSSLALPREFYALPRSFPRHNSFTLAHTANQVQFNGRKGHVQIIEALRILKSRGKSIKARFAGGDYNGGVQKLKEYAKDLGVSDMVEFVGYLSRQELDNFLTTSDLYVMPTKAEGLPRVIIEAMAKGLPCITTPVSGNPELVDKHFLVDYYDVKRLAERVEELISDKELYEETSRLNYENSLKYEASVLQARRDDFYSKLKSRIKTN